MKPLLKLWAGLSLLSDLLRGLPSRLQGMAFLHVLSVGARILAVLLAIVAIAPMNTDGFESHPHPAHGFTDAVSRVTRQQAADDSVAAVGGRTILLTHGHSTARAVVLLHGFSNSPRQFRAIAESLYATGDNVYVPRLPHQGERNATASTLGELSAEELRNSSDSVVDVAQGLGDSVVVVGLSMGGTMAAWIGQYRRDVQRVVVISPPFELWYVPSFFAPAVLNLAVRLPDITQNFAADTARPDRALGNSSNAIGQMLRFGLEVRRAADREAPRVHDAVFVMNAADRTVKPEPITALADLWARKGAAVEVYEFPDSLKLPHDVIDGAELSANPTVVYPVVKALAHGGHPPAFLLTPAPRRARP